MPRFSPCASRAGSPRSSPSSSPRKTGGLGEGSFEEQGSWWESLPRSYTVKRRWHEIVRFHEALVNELTWDHAIGCSRVKAKIPTLPGKADLDSWTNSYAATGDACALSRRLKIAPPTSVAPRGRHHEAPMNDLEDLHWRYVELRLVPYFAQVNNVLKELPTNILAGSVALRRFALPGSRAGMQKPANNQNGMPRRFLGTQEPVVASAEDVARAAAFLRRTQPDALRSFSAPSLTNGAAAKRGSPSAAAAKLVVAGSSGNAGRARV